MKSGRSNFVLACAVVAMFAAASPAGLAAQGVTTGGIGGVVTGAQNQPIPGASVIAIHEPSGTSYEATTRADGRYSVPAMRVGGPYTIQVVYTGGGGGAFAPKTVGNVNVNLGVTSDVDISVEGITVAENVEVTGVSDPVFASTRTGAATSVGREDIATLPTISGRLESVTRLTPQASGTSFAGQDNRLNNITVDGSYFNNSFGLGAQPGERTNVAPISLEAIEQVQVSIAPFDVRQGSFIGAAINSVTRSGTNQFSGSVYHRMRNEEFVGTKAAGLAVNPGTFTFRDTGVWGSGPIVKNRLFAFGNYENEEDSRPLTTFRANTGNEPVGGSITRVLASDLTALSSFLSQNFQFDPGGYEGFIDLTPAKRYLLRTDYNVNSSNKVSFRYNQLDSSSDGYTSGSSSAGIGRSPFTTSHLSFASSTYSILENIKSGIGEWNTVIGQSMSNNLIVGLTSNDESRKALNQLFPFVDILVGGTAYTSFGSEPFTPQNELHYKTFQLQDSFTKYGNKHTMTFGATTQRYQSENVFWNCCPQSNYTYNSLEDYYTDARGYLANPNRTTSPVTLRAFKVRYTNLPGLEKPLQPLGVWYSGAYAQDEWRPRRDLTVTAGIRFDASVFENTAFQNARADALTFRDEAGLPVQYQTGKMPDSKILWSPRVASNWDVAGRGRTQVRLGTGLFTGPPLYVWISNQLGNAGVLIGEIFVQNTTAFPFHPNPDKYKPATVTGEGATSFELNVTDPDFKFPQVWRTNAAVDHRLPGGVTGTVEFLYNRDVNGTYYINANLPAAQTTFTGPDSRPRWTANRINNTTGNVITSAFVLKNQSVGSSWNLSGSLSKSLWNGLMVRGAYSHGRARNTIDPGSTAFSTFANNQHAADPNNPGLGYSGYSQGHRVFVAASYIRRYFSFGSTTVSTFWEAKPSFQNFASNFSYVFAGDMNGDGFSGNDLIYIPRDTSEMNFVPFTHTNGRVFTAAEQAAAFEAYIGQDPYLRKHRSAYAERGGQFLPMFNRMDLSLIQDVFRNIGGKRNAGQFRVDVTNFGNLLNSDWGVGRRLVVSTTAANGAQLLTSPAVDAQGRPSYRLAVVSNELVNSSFQTGTALSDVYQVLFSFRYTFN
ncbi:MAG: carboxypeptidase regulatory-like domain-containing protein [Vicinamibacterales bacterium]